MKRKKSETYLLHQLGSQRVTCIHHTLLCLNLPQPPIRIICLIKNIVCVILVFILDVIILCHIIPVIIIVFVSLIIHRGVIIPLDIISTAIIVIITIELITIISIIVLLTMLGNVLIIIPCGARFGEGVGHLVGETRLTVVKGWTE